MSCLLNPDGTSTCYPPGGGMFLGGPIDVQLFPLETEVKLETGDVICPEGLFYNGNTCIPLDMGMVKDPNYVGEPMYAVDPIDKSLVVYDDVATTMDNSLNTYDSVVAYDEGMIKRTAVESPIVTSTSVSAKNQINWLPIVLVGLGVYILFKSKAE